VTNKPVSASSYHSSRVPSAAAFNPRSQGSENLFVAMPVSILRYKLRYKLEVMPVTTKFGRMAENSKVSI
jgi:hypothetical protein